MSQTKLPRWSEISREERFFTAMLFHDVLAKSGPLLRLLVEKLRLPQQSKIIDVGFEAAFFRDAALDKRIESSPALEAQKFDLLLGFSDKRTAIIEAKAQQGFRTDQIKMLHKARALMEESRLWPATKVHIVGLWSSQYSPRQKTRNSFDAFLTWLEVADLYPENQEIYRRADAIYSDR